MSLYSELLQQAGFGKREDRKPDTSWYDPASGLVNCSAVVECALVVECIPKEVTVP